MSHTRGFDRLASGGSGGVGGGRRLMGELVGQSQAVGVKTSVAEETEDDELTRRLAQLKAKS